MKFQPKIVALACSVALLGACGGGGDDVANADAQGIWSGTNTNGYDVAVVVLENGETWGVYASNNGIDGALYGSASTSGNTISVTGSDLNLSTWSVSSGTYRGTVAEKSSMSLSSSRTGDVATLTYESFYDTPASLSTLAGSYTISGVSKAGSAQDEPMTISSSGVITIPGVPTCSATGVVQPRSSGKNVFNLSMTFSGVDCALGDGGTASGILVYDDGEAIALALTADKQDGFIAAASRAIR